MNCTGLSPAWWSLVKSSIAVSPEYKTCNRCGREYLNTRDYFRFHYQRGTVQPCKVCWNEQARVYRESSPDKKRESNRRWRQANPDKSEQSTQNYRSQHPEQVRAAEYRWQKSHQETVKASSKKYRFAHPEKALIRWHRREAIKRALPAAFSAADWQLALNYWHGCCAICERPAGLWHTLAADHWIPLADIKHCPGTVPTNIVPLCHGIDGCNNSKADCDPVEWLKRRIGKRAATKKLAEIEAYFKFVRGDTD